MPFHGELHGTNSEKKWCNGVDCHCAPHVGRYYSRSQWNVHNRGSGVRARVNENYPRPRPRAAAPGLAIGAVDPEPDPGMQFDEEMPLNWNDEEMPLWEYKDSMGMRRACDFTVKESVTLFLMVFTRFGIPRAARRAIFDLLRILLPAGNGFPRHTSIEYSVAKYSLHYSRIPTCPNNCVVHSKYSVEEFSQLVRQFSSLPQEYHSHFRSVFEHYAVDKNCRTCPECSMDIMKRNPRTGAFIVDKPVKEFLQIDIRKSVQQLYKDKDFVQQANISRKHLDSSNAGKDIFTSQEWKAKVVDTRIHSRNGGRDLVLCFLADGICPFTRRKSHSMDVQGFYIMNLPKRYRNSIRNILLSGIVGGPEKVKDAQPYLLQMIIQLLEIEREGGVLVEDIMNPGQFLRIRLHVLWTLGDLPALAKIWGWAEGGYSACLQCEQPGERARAINRQVWSEYKRCLDATDPRRGEGADRETRPPWPTRKPEDAISNAKTAWDLRKAGVKSHIVDHRQATGASNTFVLAILGLYPSISSWFDRMHVIKGWFVHLIYTLRGKRTPKNAENMTAEQLQEADQQLCSIVADQKRSTLTRAKMEEVHTRQHFIEGPARFITKKPLFRVTGQWKIREQQQFLTATGRYLLAGLYDDKPEWRVFLEHVFTSLGIIAAGAAPDDMQAAEEMIKSTLLLYDKLMPETEKALIIHVTKHLFEQLSRVGALIDCYPWERFCGWVGRLIGSTFAPEVNAMNAYSHCCYVAETVHSLDLIQKVEKVNSEHNDFKQCIGQTIINDLFDVHTTFSSDEYSLYMKYTCCVDRRLIRGLRRAIKLKMKASIEAGFHIEHINYYSRACIKGRPVGCEKSLTDSSWVRIGKMCGQVRFFLQVTFRKDIDALNGVDIDEAFERLMVLIKPMQRVRQSVHGEYEFDLFCKNFDQDRLYLVTDVTAQVALGKMGCRLSAGVNGAALTIPEADHDTICPCCMYMVMDATNFTHY